MHKVRTQVREGLTKGVEESDQKRLSIVLVKSSFHSFVQERTREVEGPNIRLILNLKDGPQR